MNKIQNRILFECRTGKHNATLNGNEAMHADRYEAMKRELWSDLMSMVETGDLTDVQAMEWFNDKCDQWSR